MDEHAAHHLSLSPPVISDGQAKGMLAPHSRVIGAPAATLQKSGSSLRTAADFRISAQCLFSTGLQFGSFAASGGLLLISGHTDSARNARFPPLLPTGRLPAPVHAAGIAGINRDLALPRPGRETSINVVER
jgi:hypothetical protein